jgi:phosphonate transport system substrate-binding protein
MHRRHLVGLVGLAGGLGPVALRAAEPPIRLGLVPYLSPAALLATFRPWREQFSASLARPVQSYTARDFHAHVAAIHAAEYDLALVPAHLARLAVRDWGWAPMAATVLSTPVFVVVRGGGPIRAPADLAGQRVGTLDLLSLTAAVAIGWITRQGLAIDVQTLASINSALVALERDELAAVVMAASQLQGLGPQTPTGQRMLARIGDIPGPQIVARPGLPTATLERWRRALWAFRPDPARPLTAANSPLSPLSDAAMVAVDPYADYLRQQLAKR